MGANDHHQADGHYVAEDTPQSVAPQGQRSGKAEAKTISPYCIEYSVLKPTLTRVERHKAA